VWLMREEPEMTVNILAVGDIVGNSGLNLLRQKLASIKRLKNISFTVVNGENAAQKGLTPSQAEEIFNSGADVITLGNHAFGKQNIIPYLDECRYILRPANLAPQNPGRGYGIFETSFGQVCVINLIGRCGMNFGPDNPFIEADKILKKIDTKIVLVDMHAEATSEKLALGYYLDGRVSVMWGTHTHVQTADSRVFPKGMGYITDLGMTGPAESVIGIKPEISVSMFLGNPPKRYETAKGPCKMDCAVFEIDEATGLCKSVESFQISE
jgi:metallophosphoesterase (TIGR00282 family)